MEKHGTIYRVAGPVVTATGISPRMYDVMLVGEEGLMGEVIKIAGDKTIIQVYEETSGLKPGEKVIDTHQPLVAELGPGLLSSVYDGIQRPLPVLMEAMGNFIQRGVTANGLNREKKWKFEPIVKKGDKVIGGSILGTVKEFYLVHKIMVPPGISGTVDEIREGEFTVDEVVAKVGGKDIMMMQKWPVRSGRPFVKKLLPNIPLITGQRVLDTMFPLPKGGTAAIPGAFGTGKTVTQQQLAKWSDAEIVVYIGCGERGNEMTEVLATFPELEDPKTGEPLMQRTVLIANTSNMPVAAREASVYTGMTIAEYYRDMGYNVSLMADSTSPVGRGHERDLIPSGRDARRRKATLPTCPLGSLSSMSAPGAWRAPTAPPGPSRWSERSPLRAATCPSRSRRTPSVSSVCSGRSTPSSVSADTSPPSTG